MKHNLSRKNKLNKNKNTRGARGSFSETTTATFSADFVLGNLDGGKDITQGVQSSYQFQTGLNTSFTGEDSFDITIDNGNPTQSDLGELLGFDYGSSLTVDGVSYSFPVGEASVLVGDNTDISAVFTGACAYSAFTDLMSDCGTGNTLGVGTNGITAAVSYDFGNGFTLAGGFSSDPEAIYGGESDDTFGVEFAYTADNYGVAVAYTSKTESDECGTRSTNNFWGVNGFYSFEDQEFPTITVGYETQVGDEKTGYFAGLTWPEVGPGSVSIGAATNGLFDDSAAETLTYEVSYSYPINDGMTITPGVFIQEVDGGDDLTGVAVKTSFSF